MRVAVGQTIEEFDDEDFDAAWKFIVNHLNLIENDAAIVIENQHGESHRMIVDKIMFEALCESPSTMQQYLNTFGYSHKDD